MSAVLQNIVNYPYKNSFVANIESDVCIDQQRVILTRLQSNY